MISFPWNLRTFAATVLPAPLYQRLSGSAIAKRLARGSLWSLAFRRSWAWRGWATRGYALVAQVAGMDRLSAAAFRQAVSGGGE